jgi:leader peptidase (prepilin peptidase)/N-methyltransferase
MTVRLGAGVTVCVVLLAGWATTLAARWFDRHLDGLLDHGLFAEFGRPAGRARGSSPSPVFEIGAMLLMGSLALTARSLATMAAGMGLSAALLLCAWIDWRKRILPDLVVLPLLAVGLLLAMRWRPFVGETEAVGGALLGWCMGRAVRSLGADRHGRLGRGDLKLLAAIGAWLGPVGVTIILLTSSYVMLVSLLVCRKGREDRNLPFGPAIAVGAVLYLYLIFMMPSGEPAALFDALANFLVGNRVPRAAPTG